MKASAVTINTLLQLLPREVYHRYDISSFPLLLIGQILSDIEKKSNGDYFIDELALLVGTGQIDYALSDAVRHVRGIYKVPAGTIVPDRFHPIEFKQIGSSVVRLNSTYTLSGDDEILGTATSGTLTTMVDTTAGVLDDVDLSDNDLTGRILILTHIADSSIEYRLIYTNDVAAKSVTISKPFASAAVVGDTFKITSDYLLLEFERYLTRPTATTQVIDVPQGFEDVVEAGLKYKYYMQIEPQSQEGARWQQEYESRLSKMRNDLSLKTGDYPRLRARSVPKMFG